MEKENTDIVERKISKKAWNIRVQKYYELLIKIAADTAVGIKFGSSYFKGTGATASLSTILKKNDVLIPGGIPNTWKWNPKIKEINLTMAEYCLVLIQNYNAESAMKVVKEREEYLSEDLLKRIRKHADELHVNTLGIPEVLNKHDKEESETIFLNIKPTSMRGPELPKAVLEETVSESKPKRAYTPRKKKTKQVKTVTRYWWGGIKSTTFEEIEI